MFPEPSMRLFVGSRTIPVTDSVLVVNQDYLSVSVHKNLQLIDIQDTSLLGCSLHLPGTNFSITEQQIFRKYKPRSLPQIKNRATHYTVSKLCFLLLFTNILRKII